MKHLRFLAARLTFLFFLLASLAGAVLADERGVTNDSINIGLVLVKTGPVAALGLPNGQGMVDYMNYLNEQGGINGRKIEVIWEDDQFEAPKSVAAVKKLIHRDKVLTILTTGGTNQTIANMDNINFIFTVFEFMNTTFIINTVITKK